jgi:histone-binding protein RBBP4
MYICIYTDNPTDEKIIAEEYKVWKKNTPFLYDLVMTHALEWPSLTCQWLPGKDIPTDAEYSEQRLLIGTHTSGGEDNHLILMKVKLPLEETEIDCRKGYDENGELGGFGGVATKLDICLQLKHKGEVNRARYMPQNKNVIATKSPTHDCYIFDLTKHAEAADVFKPDITLKGHEAEGYGLAWNPNSSGLLLSGSDDAKICLWDISAAKETLNAGSIYTGHSGIVGDIAWHHQDVNIFGSVGDDKKVLLWDTRSKDSSKASQTIQDAHTADINCISFNPQTEFLFATGSADKTVALWDSRNLERKLHSFDGHGNEVLQIQWCPFNDGVIGSCSSDRRLHVWDMSKIGAEQSPEDAEDGPPELLFIHGGHTAKISDMSWNEEDEWIVASVAEDNILQIWQMAANLYAPEDEEEDHDLE